MNIMRILRGQNRAGEAPPTAQDNTLGLMHLKKLFSEFKHPPQGTTQKDLEDKLYNMLPLFCKVSHGKFSDSSFVKSRVHNLHITFVRGQLGVGSVGEKCMRDGGPNTEWI